MTAHLQSEPRSFFSNAPETPPLSTRAWVASARGPFESEFETDKSDLGLGEDEVRSWAGWHHPMTMCLLASAFLLTMQQEWGEKDAPAHAPPDVPDRPRTVAAGALHARGTAAVAGRDATAQ